MNIVDDIGVQQVKRDDKSLMFDSVHDERRHIAEERFRLAIEASPNGMILVDTEGKLVFLNSETERIFGYSRGELLGQPVETLMPHAHRGHHGDLRRFYMGAPERRAMGNGLDFAGLRKDGTPVTLEIGLNPVVINNTMFILASLVDVTARNQAEVERCLLVDQLREAVAARDAFLSIASHELRTPLTALQLTVQSLTRSLHKKQNAAEAGMSMGRLADGLAATARQVGRLNNLVDQLLDVSRVTAGRLMLERERFDLGELVCEVVERFSDAASDFGSKIQVEVGEKLIGDWDRNRLDQVLTNLLMNAQKYGRGSPIEVRVRSRAEEVCLEVRDRGIGIARADQARIFKQFERVVSNRHFGGFGLGLWIARQFIEAHGGEINVQSQVDKGSTFEVVLPKSPPADSPPPQDAA